MTHTAIRRALLALSLLSGAPAFAADVVRHKIPNSDFPIALAVEVPAGKKIVFLSGDGPTVADKTAPPNSVASFGNTKTQAASTLASIKSTLKSLKLDMKDVVKMTVFIVADPANGNKIDFAGFMEAYGEHFGKTQPNLPARSTVTVAGLVNPGWLIEIEVVAVAPK